MDEEDEEFQQMLEEIESKASTLSSDKLVCAALDLQHMLVKKVPAKEQMKWEEGELESYKLDFRSIDRVYRHSQENHDEYLEDSIISTCCVEIYVRAKYKSNHIFVGLSFKRILTCSLRIHHMDIHHSGLLMLTCDVDTFYKSMVKAYFEPGVVYKSLSNDGYSLFGSATYNKLFHNEIDEDIVITSPLSLQSICLQTIYDHRTKFFSDDGKIVLHEDMGVNTVPILLQHYIHNFVESQEVRKYFEKDHADYFHFY